ncbi:EamA family transporter [Rhodoferax koreense]|uniref:EamA family transporter n=1 Tax=Rhodoferax koreensis TaxID=1842727 RepID=A0A1P8JZV0_9BURK|nr:DMT family transporter [Rhodoferax koreense]APW39286.1 EamA family transporter [Rhodoferax koreense]
MSAATPALFQRHTAVLLIALLGCAFAGNHISARLAFDHGTGLLVAIVCRSGVTMLALLGVVLWQREALRLPRGAWPWQLAVGLLIATQSLCLYSAVARIPVALALLVSNTLPVVLALLTWALGGPRPTRRASVLMGVILLGLVLALDVPTRLASMEAAGPGPQWGQGIAFAAGAALAFAMALWITDHKLKALRGSVRSLMTLSIVFVAMLLAGWSGAVPGGMAWPHDAPGWTGLGLLVLLYGTAFSVMFITLPRLDMARNAAVMNSEPIATLLFGWLILGQRLGALQVLGGLVVVGGIVLLTTSKAR